MDAAPGRSAREFLIRYIGRAAGQRGAALREVFALSSLRDKIGKFS